MVPKPRGLPHVQEGKPSFEKQLSTLNILTLHLSTCRTLERPPSWKTSSTTKKEPPCLAGTRHPTPTPIPRVTRKMDPTKLNFLKAGSGRTRLGRLTPTGLVTKKVSFRIRN